MNPTTFLINSRLNKPLPQKGTSQSRILQKKQIQKRLQGLSLKQYERIQKNLLKQNQKLKQQVEILGQKVQKLIQSKKISIQSQKSTQQIQQNILITKKQLQKQYSIMLELKSQIEKQNQLFLTQQVKSNLVEKKNHIKSIEKQLQSLNIEKDKIINQLKNNQIDYQEYIPTKQYMVECEKMKEENKSLKKKVNHIMMNIKNNQLIAKQALTKIYTLKKQNNIQLISTMIQVDNNNRTLSKPNRIRSLSLLHKLPTISTRNQHNLTQMNIKTLQTQISSLKKKKNQIESQLQSQKYIKQQQKSRLQKQIRELLQYHKQLFKRRVRQLTQLNYYQKKQQEYKNKNKQKIQLLQSRVKVQYGNKMIQTDNVIKKIYRTDWVGKINDDQYNNNNNININNININNINNINNNININNTQNFFNVLHFDDTYNLEYKQSTYIRSITIYRTIDHIIFIKFHYENKDTKKKSQTKLPFDKEIIKKIQAKRVVSKQNGYLVNMIVSITKGIVTKIQTKWSDGDSLVQGWDSDDSDKYKFDILTEKERPLSFFGMLKSHPKTTYALAELGCEILDSS